MKNTVYMILLIIVSGISFLTGCSEDEPVITQQNPVQTEKGYGAFILCAGNEQYPPERYLAYYDINSDSLNLNILQTGQQLPQTPTTMEYSNGILYTPISTNVFPVNPRIITIGAWGETKGNIIMEKYPETKVGALQPFNSYLAVTYYPDNSFYGTLEIRNKNSYEWLFRYPNIKSYISAIRYLNNKLYLLISEVNNIYADSSLAVVEPFNESVTKIPLRKHPNGLVVTNEGKLIAACSGSSNMLYHIDPGTMTKTDSVISNNGFQNRLRYNSGNSMVYFISKDDKIIKYIPSSKTFVVFINNDLSSEGYAITGYNIDQYTGKHYVLYTNVNSYKPGKLRVYNSSGFFEKMFNTPKTPVDVIIEKEP